MIIMLLHFFWNSFSFILTLSILITVHECGHFLAARFFKVKVERFSIGFGPVLWKWCDSHNTEYVISAILFGGYVKLFNTQEEITVRKQGYNNAFDYKSIWKRSIIVISGPFFNFIFSVISYILVFIIGVPTYKPIISSVLPNTIIAQSGIQAGAEIESINGIKTNSWDAVRLEIFNNIGREDIAISTAATDNTRAKTYIIHLSQNWFNTLSNTKDPIIALGILPFNTQIIPVLSDIKLDSIAQQSGLKIGDKIISVNEQPIYDWQSFIVSITNSSEKIFQITVERKNRIFNLNLTLSKTHAIHCDQVEELIGIVPKIIIIPSEHYSINQYGLIESILQACAKTWKLICLTTNTLFKLVIGNISINNLGGPIAIAQGAGASAHSGLIYYLMFLSLISINLGIINLLPLPTLDGGHLLFLIVEKVKGKSISQEIQNFGYIISSIVLLLIMCVTIFNDISRLW